MTVWIFALLLLGILAAVGYNQGAIRGGISLVGLIAASLLATPLAPLVKLLFRPVGLENPPLVWTLAPFVVFALVLVLFKVVGLIVHRRVVLYYKYNAGDLRLGLWEQLNQRLGLCLGLANGATYLLLISLVIYPFSYLTTQMAAARQDPLLLRLLNRAGRDLQVTGLDKAVAAISPMPAAYYQAADIGGLLYHNPLVHGRLSRYPALLGLSEWPEFQAIAQDKNYFEMLQKGASLAEVARHEKTKAITRNPQLLREIWALAHPDLQDLSNFVATGKSAKYDGEKILGRWTFEMNGAITALKKTRPNLTPSQLQYYKMTIFPPLANLTLTITPDKQVLVKNLARINFGVSPPQASQPQNLRGRWQHYGAGSYRLILDSAGKTENLEALIEGDRLTIGGETIPLVLEREK